ncbi:hypothetical protein SLEP1_g57178 [Rubroshorea leprosula]|uniref:Bulb-type lectin domain-containing protein n=1 Tax=Rubroshorea leprosula TaxID=152421 RepID=A0AAV5MLS7_9ROSI|nr:hypothetical protein SLEP1_g57178 [Rubroshorea leprosula]
MSVSCSDLLCGEDSADLFSGQSPQCSSEFDSSACIEESSIASFIEGERNFVPGFDYLARFQSQSLDASAREESVAFAWILKVKWSPTTLKMHSPFPLGRFSCSTNFITSSTNLSDGGTLVSSDGSFELGFFSSGSTAKRRYLGIWLKNIPVQNVVWVANRSGEQSRKPRFKRNQVPTELQKGLPLIVRHFADLLFVDRPPISLPPIVRRSSPLSLHFFCSADLHHLPHLIGSKQNRSSSGKWFLSSAKHLLLISSVDCRSPPPSSLD